MPTKSYEQIKREVVQDFAEALKQGIDSEIDYTLKHSENENGPEFTKGYLRGLAQVKVNFVDQIAAIVVKE